jgi:hypothetical protein
MTVHVEQWTGRVVQAVECLCSKCEALSSNPKYGHQKEWHSRTTFGRVWPALSLIRMGWEAQRERRPVLMALVW